jgi:hypothetical protein
MIVTSTAGYHSRSGLRPRPNGFAHGIRRGELASVYTAVTLLGCLLAALLLRLAAWRPGDVRADEMQALVTPCVGRGVACRRRTREQGGGGTAGGEIGASYARYSSELQDASSVADQRRKCRERAERDGVAIAPEFEFADEAVSGTRADREGLNALMDAARQGRFQRLYIENLSRLARESVISMPTLKELVHVCGVRIISLTEGIDSSTDSWDILATIFSLQHEQFVKYLSHAVFRGQEGNVLAGYSVGDCCLGYQSVPIPGSEAARRGRNAKPRMQYVVDPDTAAWVVRIFHWFTVERRSILWITRELTRRNAPKDHRATTTAWHHSYVRGVLGNSKYVGVWPWGKLANRRNPMTGRVRQEPRDDQECEKWVRRFPHLRIITDEAFEAAQAILRANEEKLGRRRRSDGRLRGSPLANAAAHPRHLLSGLVRCAACGTPFQVGGTGGKYLTCRQYLAGSCSCKTLLPRDRAERMILEAIGERVLASPAWRKAVHDALEAAYRRQQAELPAALRETEQALAAVEDKIRRLVDQVENGLADPDVAGRLATRRAERQALLKKREDARRAGEAALPPPSEAWVEEKLKGLRALLGSREPAAAHALRQLVGGQVLVEEVKQPGRKRHFLRGKFTIQTAALLASVGGRQTAAPSPNLPAEAGEEIVLDFREPDSHEGLADRVKELFDSGVSFDEMAAQMGCHRNTVAKALAYWYEQRGLTAPDGRSCRQRLARPTLPERLADAAKEFWDRGLLMQEIAARLGTNPDTVTKAVEHWFRSRGLEEPDGRTRRKSLPHNCSSEEPAGPVEQGTEGEDSP